MNGYSQGHREKDVYKHAVPRLSKTLNTLVVSIAKDSQMSAEKNIKE